MVMLLHSRNSFRIKLITLLLLEQAKDSTGSKESIYKTVARKTLNCTSNNSEVYKAALKEPKHSKLI